jgi:intracellular sulfur oxidation DsrE/DsrF family protein
MLRQLLILATVALLLWWSGDLLLRDRAPAARSGSGAPSAEPQILVPPMTGAQAGYVADISVHSVEELEALFQRIETLLDRPRGSDEAPLVSLVLHGPEVEFFAFRNYPQYRDVVDRAAKLAALGAVEISICQTQMRSRGIAEDEVPGFLRQVPYGPDEVRKLLDSGYVYM